MRQHFGPEDILDDASQIEFEDGDAGAVDSRILRFNDMVDAADDNPEFSEDAVFIIDQLQEDLDGNTFDAIESVRPFFPEMLELADVREGEPNTLGMVFSDGVIDFGPRFGGERRPVNLNGGRPSGMAFDVNGGVVPFRVSGPVPTPPRLPVAGLPLPDVRPASELVRPPNRVPPRPDTVEVAEDARDRVVSVANVAERLRSMQVNTDASVRLTLDNVQPSARQIADAKANIDAELKMIEGSPLLEAQFSSRVKQLRSWRIQLDARTTPTAPRPEVAPEPVAVPEDRLSTDFNRLAVNATYSPGSRELIRELGLRVAGDRLMDGRGNAMCRISLNDRFQFTRNASGDLRVDASGASMEHMFIVAGRDIADDNGTIVLRKGDHIETGLVGNAERRALSSPDGLTRQLMAAPTELVRGYEIFSANGTLTVNGRRSRNGVLSAGPRSRSVSAERNAEGGWDIALENARFRSFEWVPGQRIASLLAMSADGPRWERENQDKISRGDTTAWDPNVQRSVLRWTDESGKTGVFVFSRPGTLPQAVLSVCEGGVEQFPMTANPSGGPGRVFARKPVIYLYPTKETEVTVGVQLSGMTFTTLYPKMNGDRWTVSAKPDGRLTAGGKEYGYLFWEAVAKTPWALDEAKAFCVPSGSAGQFLEESLSVLGLNAKERNDFIVYWLPKLEQNPFSLVQFLGSEYTDAAKLDISPKPDSVIRVFMVFKSLQTAVSTSPTPLKPVNRSGFAVVEWGGSDLDEGSKVA